MSGEAVLHVKFPFMRMCDICHKNFRSLYRIEIDGIPVYACTGAELNEAQRRWKEKKEMNMGPTLPRSKEENLMEEGGLPEEEGDI